MTIPMKCPLALHTHLYHANSLIEIRATIPHLKVWSSSSGSPAVPPPPPSKWMATDPKAAKQKTMFN